MKVALIGNMNNNLSVLWRFLLDRGVDAYLFSLPGDPDHFSLAADTFRPDLVVSKIRKLDFLDVGNFFSVQPDQLRKTLSEFDFIIACGISLGFLARAKIVIDIAIPYGAEFFDLGYYRLLRPRYILHYNGHVYYHRQAFRHGIRHLMLDYTNPWFEQYVNRFGSNAKRFYLAPPMVYSPDFNPERVDEFAPQSAFFQQVKEIRRRHKFLIFHHSSHNWLNPGRVYFYKGNHHLFNGFAEFLKLSGEDACIVTIEYGKEVDESKRLIAQLGIEDRVYWFPKAQRKDLLLGISLSDLVVGEMNDERSYHTYGVAFEAMAMAKPIMHHCRSEMYRPYHESLYPTLNARCDEDVTNGLLQLASDPNHLRQMGNEARQWFDEFAIKKPVDTVVALIEQKDHATRFLHRTDRKQPSLVTNLKRTGAI